MNKAGINNGGLVLVLQQQTEESGDWVKEHKPIILDRDFKVRGVVITTLWQAGVL
jgi:hypothetical protein